MMLLAPLLLAPAAAIAPAPADAMPAEDRQIVVMAQRLRAIDANMARDKAGKWHCSLSGTSGADWIDDRLCRTTTRCTRKYDGEQDKIEQCVAADRSGILEEFRRRLRENEHSSGSGR